jgi:hypothetical protein
MMYDLNAGALATGDSCMIAKKSWNDARMIFLAFMGLTLILVTALVVASIYAIWAFKDDQQARGFLALLAAVASGAVFILLGKLTKDAKDHQATMADRVAAACNPPAA